MKATREEINKKWSTPKIVKISACDLKKNIITGACSIYVCNSFHIESIKIGV